MARGKVITTHLRTGDPNGIRTVFISNKICEMIVFPKSEFDAVSKMEESSRPALYILLGEDENGSAQAYIGESTNGVKRIYNHKSHKLFWNKCLMFVAKDESINKADVQYLERKAIDLFCVDLRWIAGERGGRRAPLRELCETAESSAALDVFLKTLVHTVDYTKKRPLAHTDGHAK